MTIIENVQVKNEIANKQLTLIKPSINELLHAFIEYHEFLKNTSRKGPWNWDFDDEIKNTMAWGKLSNQAFKYLSSCEYEDYDLVNFDRLIASIELNGKKHFNMTSFMGILDRDEIRSCEYGSKIFNLDSGYIGNPEVNDQYFNVTTKEFNCDTVGCIAGFCVANAVDWNDNLWKKATGFNSNHHDLYETIACSFLNIPIQVGKKIFYGDNGSIWVLFAQELTNIKEFKDLQYDEDYCNDDESAVELNSISPKAAVKALTLIKDKDIYFQQKYNYNPFMSKKLRDRKVEE